MLKNYNGMYNFSYNVHINLKNRQVKNRFTMKANIPL